LATRRKTCWCRYGTPETLAIIKERAKEIAAVLVEPVQSRRPDFQPREFLHELRAITRDSGSLLIFDEVVTGFRAHPRGVQQYFDIDVDLAAAKSWRFPRRI
jgi:glutamate-1-semialdehyde aminotransferase